jgi:hypothetical protein
VREYVARDVATEMEITFTGRSGGWNPQAVEAVAAV